jgi:pimeloyl-ACP methyl ester carboxylesterase
MNHFPKPFKGRRDSRYQAFESRHPGFERIEPPAIVLLASEWRGLWEHAGSLALSPLLHRMTPAGDGHPVVLIPGLGASDATTYLLRRFLADKGYDARGWGLGTNNGFSSEKLDRFRFSIEDAYRITGRPVSLIGWSLGGIFAREVAKKIPGQVRCVMTLGTPFSGHPLATNATWLYEWLSGETLLDVDRSVIESIRSRPPVPTSSLYSRLDGVVSWRCSIDEETDRSENIEIPGASHIGLGFNPMSVFVIADRLAQPMGSWSKFGSLSTRLSERGLGLGIGMLNRRAQGPRST